MCRPGLGEGVVSHVRVEGGFRFLQRAEFFSGPRDAGTRSACACECWNMAYGFMFCWFGCVVFGQMERQTGMLWTLYIAVCTVSTLCSRFVVLIKSSVQCLNILA
jgi:hypothetical protein